MVNRVRGRPVRKTACVGHSDRWSVFEEEYKMVKQYTLKVYPEGMSRTVYRTIQICGSESLDTLCDVILSSLDFMDQHLYEFCMDNRMYSPNSYQSQPEGNQPSTKIALDKLNLSKGQNFSLHYDFGDDWMFKIHVQKIEDVSEEQDPAVLKSKGDINQYSDYDDDEWED